jgi:hypothetical protein
MFVNKQMLKRLSGGIAIAAVVVVVAVPSAFASSFITDTLGGNGHPKATPDAFERAVAIHNAQAQPAVDHYLGIHRATQPYVNAGMTAAVATSNDRVRSSATAVSLGSSGGTGFDWGDAGIGAGFVAGLALLLLIGASRVRGHKSRALAA